MSQKRNTYFLIWVSLGIMSLLAACTNLQSPNPTAEVPSVYPHFLFSQRDAANGQVRLSWGWINLGGQKQPLGSPAEKFFLYMAMDHPDSLALIEELGADQFQYSPTNLDLGHTYYFRVKAWVSEENFTYSDLVHLSLSSEEIKEPFRLEGDVSASFGSWSPDGKSVVFQLNEGQDESIAIGQWETGLWEEIGIGKDPSWHSENNDIAYESLADTSTGSPKNAIQIIDPANSFILESVLGGNANYVQPSWGHDDSGEDFLIYASDQSDLGTWGLYLYSPDNGGEPTLLEEAPVAGVFSQFSSLGRPSWKSQKPYTIAFEEFSEKILDLDSSYWARDIYAVDPQTKLSNPLVQSPWDDYAPAFSPCGTSLAFLSNRSGKVEIWIINLADGQLTQLSGRQAFSPASGINKITWTSDGAYILYTYLKENGKLGLARLAALGC